MTHQQLFDATIRIYEELYKQATLRRNFKLAVSLAEQKHLNNFADFLVKKYRPEELTIDFLVRYFEFQFSRYAGVQTKYGMNSILLHWLIGAKAQKEWENRDVKKNWLVRVKIRKDVQLKLHKAFKSEMHTQKQQENTGHMLTINPAEENAKKKYPNSPERYIWCGTITTLYTPVSPICQDCVCSAACQKLLKREYPNTYKLRIKNVSS